VTDDTTARADLLTQEWDRLLRIQRSAEKVVWARNTGGHLQGWINDLERLLTKNEAPT